MAHGKHMRKSSFEFHRFLHKLLNNIKIIYETSKVLKSIIDVFHQ